MKKLIEFIKELRKKPYGKGVIFFGVYLIFFIVVFSMLSLGDNKNSDESKNKSFFEKYNYSFEYKVVLDNNTYTYVGSKEAKVFKYNYNGKEYYNRGYKSYIKEESWKEVENPIKFNKFFDEEIVENIINSSYTDYRTTYGSGDTEYNLLVSSNTLNKIIEEKDTDYEEVPNKIKINISKDKLIKDINYNLDNYCKMNNICNSLNITVNYSNYSSKS